MTERGVMFRGGKKPEAFNLEIEKGEITKEQYGKFLANEFDKAIFNLARDTDFESVEIQTTNVQRLKPKKDELVSVSMSLEIVGTNENRHGGALRIIREYIEQTGVREWEEVDKFHFVEFLKKHQERE